jgi:integral membrane protein (TIGR00529 family)
MEEFIGAILSFFSIPLLTKKKVSIGVAICTCACILSILSGLGIKVFFDVFIKTMTDPNKIKQYIVIAQIGILGVLLKKYNFINKIINCLTKVIKNKRIILMLIPSLVGLLIVPGGAIISAPFVDRIGDESKIPKTERAIINLIYRHISMNIMPYSTGLLIVTLLVPQISIYSLIGLNSIFVIIYCLVGYFIYIRKIENVKVDSNESSISDLINLLKYTSPIYIAVVLNILFDVEFHIGLLVNFIAVYLLNPTKEFVKDIAGAFNIKVLLSIIGVYMIQELIGKMEYLNHYLLQLFSNTNTTMVGIIVISVFFGLTTGFQPTALGVILPILGTLRITNNLLLLYSHFAFVWSFLGYFFSPLHLCQLFTCEFLDVKTSELYRDYSKFFVLLIATQVVSYFILNAIIR